MRNLGHVWTVFTNLAGVALAMAMFGVASTRFETVVVAGVVLIY